MKRILVVRGGAIGDFVLTLPAIKLLRENFPDAHLEILGYKQIAALADGRFYANEIRSLESATFARFFAKDAELPLESAAYFRSFDLVVSYLYDPDEIFQNNVRRTGVKDFIAASPIIGTGEHAARQLARPLEKPGLNFADNAPRILPSDNDRKFADNYLAGLTSPIIALHPGSGGESKNWPLENWIELQARLATSMLVIGGEADRQQLRAFRELQNPRMRFAIDLPLSHVAALIEKCACFIGHDSGISHIAAAVGTTSILLFGPTDPAIWAPANENVRVLRAADHALNSISVEQVYELMRIGIST